MPFLKSTTGRDKGVHPDAYWTIAEIHLDVANASAYAIYRAYHDSDEWSEPTSGQPEPIAGAEVAIPVSGIAYDTLLYRYRSEPTTKLFALIEELAAVHPAFAGATWTDFPPLPE